jgi:hypothetical protein
VSDPNLRKLAQSVVITTTGNSSASSGDLTQQVIDQAQNALSWLDDRGILNDLMYPSGSKFAKDPNQQFYDVKVSVSTLGQQYLYDGSIHGNFKQNLQSYAKFTESCYKTVEARGSCLVLGVSSATYHISALDFSCAVLCSIFELLSAMSVCCFTSGADSMRSRGNYVVRHF